MVRIDRLTSSDADRIVEVLFDAFQSYPVMRFVADPGTAAMRHVRLLISYFVARRTHLNGPLLGLFDDGRLVGAATMTLPQEPPAPPDLLAIRDELWTNLGDGAHERYEAYVAGVTAFAYPSPHHHLNMIGVLKSHAGRGLARPLLEGVFDIARTDPDSRGVSLTTETAANVRLYERFGFSVVGHVRVADTLESWGMFRPS